MIKKGALSRCRGARSGDLSRKQSRAVPDADDAHSANCKLDVSGKEAHCGVRALLFTIDKDTSMLLWPFWPLSATLAATTRAVRHANATRGNSMSKGLITRFPQVTLAHRSRGLSSHVSAIFLPRGSHGACSLRRQQ
jgi:hypothetical protein